MFDIAVIGCGAIGLTTAIEIQKKFGNVGNVTIFADKFSPGTTSDVAAGLWEPYILGDTNIENVLRWSRSTYDYVLNLWKEGKAKEAGISLQPVVNLTDDKNYKLPEWAAISLGHNELSARHLQSLSKQYDKTFTGGFVFVSFTWEAAVFLPYLQDKFVGNGGKIVEKRIANFEQLEDFDVIVNCAGLDARTLSGDSEVVPVRGQIVRVQAPWQFTTYIVQSDDDHSCYVIPNIHSVVLGGTKQQSFDTEVDDVDKARILKNNFKLNPALRESTVLKHLVGLRPGRCRVRLEEEFRTLAGGKVSKIVHNYGHGGSGITLCVGCAQDTAELVGRMLEMRRHKL